MSTQVESISLSPQGAQFICSFEAFRSYLYRDSGGILTIGYGSTVRELDAHLYKDGITKEQGVQMMGAYVKRETAALSKMAVAGLMQHQQDAVICLAYNIGPAEFEASTIYKRISARSVDLYPWLWFIKDAKGVAQPGLATRRAKELKLFVYGLYSDKLSPSPAASSPSK